MNREEAERMLNAAPVLEQVPDSKAQEALMAVIDHPGFTVLWGLMKGAREAQMVMLAHRPIGNAEQVTQAAVIQGIIRGIAMIHDTVLEQYGESGATDQGASK